AVAGLPAVVGLLADAELLADLGQGQAGGEVGLGLPEFADDLLRGVSFPHDRLLAPEGASETLITHGPVSGEHTNLGRKFSTSCQWLGTLVVRRRSLESNSETRTEALPQKRIPCASDPRLARNGNRGTTGRRRRPNSKA